MSVLFERKERRTRAGHTDRDIEALDLLEHLENLGHECEPDVLMQTVLECDLQERRVASECLDHQRRVRHVEDGVLSRDLGRERGACRGGGQPHVTRHQHHRLKARVRVEATNETFGGRDREPTQSRGRCVVWMALDPCREGGHRGRIVPHRRVVELDRIEE